MPDHLANEHRLLHSLSARQRAELAVLLRSLIQSIEGASPLPPPE